MVLKADQTPPASDPLSSMAGATIATTPAATPQGTASLLGNPLRMSRTPDRVQQCTLHKAGRP